MIDEKKAAAGFLALLTALLGFYMLGLRQGRMGPPPQNLPAGSPSPVKSKAKTPDVRSELEFINSARLERPDAPKRNGPDTTQGQSENGVIGPAAAGYAVELSGFDSRKEAERASEGLQGQGFHPRIRNSGTKYRVEVGPYSRRGDAQAAAARLGGMGFSTSIVGR